MLGFLSKELGDDLLSHTKSTLSLAQVRFTALFEMGRGGSKPLLSPNITGNVMHGADFHQPALTNWKK